MKKIILGIVLVIAVLGVAYLVYAKFFAKSASLPFTSNLNPNCVYNDPDLCKFMNAWNGQKYYTVNGKQTEKDGSEIGMTYKLADGNNSQLIMSENGQEKYNVISIGNTTYTKDYSDNKWLKETSEPSEVTSVQDELKFNAEEDQAKKIEYKKIGTEACDKLTCFKYQVIDPELAGTNEFIYFDNKQYLLRKTRAEETNGTISESTVDYSKISILEPTPIKEGTSSSTSGTPSDVNINVNAPSPNIPDNVNIDINVPGGILNR